MSDRAVVVGKRLLQFGYGQPLVLERQLADQFSGGNRGLSVRYPSPERFGMGQ
ncbi:MAG: hypothetical protein WAU60_01360 [Candidatus Competibacter denitrificans]